MLRYVSLYPLLEIATLSIFNLLRIPEVSIFDLFQIPYNHHIIWFHCAEANYSFDVSLKTTRNQPSTKTIPNQVTSVLVSNGN